MILYDYFRSSAAYRTRIALNLKGLAPERRFVHLRKGEQRAGDYLGVNAQGLVPTLVSDDGTRLTQSLAIIEWLDEKYPEPALLPRDRDDRAFARSIALTIACDIHPIDNLRVLQYLQRELKVDDARRDAWYAHWIREGFQAIEKQLAQRPVSRFACGDTPTLADICIVPQIANAGRVKLPMEPYPRLRAINEECGKLEAFVKARPEAQPDAE
jgi:maleylacetoacetate isomerase